MSTPNAKIIRTPTEAKGGVTPEELVLLKAHAAKWTANALSTEPVDNYELTRAIQDLYAAADLKKPRVVIVPSPLVMALAGGFAAAIDHIRKQKNVAVPANLGTIVKAAADAVLRDLGTSTTLAATLLATGEALGEQLDAPGNTTKADAEIVKFFLACARNWYSMYQGGNMWSWWDCYLTAYRDVLGLRLPQYEKYESWERCAKHGGFRMMHEEFCVVSDRPQVLLIDAENRPHCEDGPSHQWRDGWSLYHWHGVKVPAKAIEAPDTITADDVRQEENQEVRRILIERMGWEKFCAEAKMKVLAVDNLEAQFPALPVSELVTDGQRFVYDYRKGTEKAELLESIEFKDFEERPLRFVRVTDPSTSRQYILRVAHNCKTPYEGVGASFGMSEAAYKKDFFLRQGDVTLQPLATKTKVTGVSRHS